MDALQAIFDIEEGEGSLEAWAYLVKTGMAWTLQGSYGRGARRLIDGGYLDSNGKILKQNEDGE
jgi:hypothetical protein